VGLNVADLPKPRAGQPSFLGHPLIVLYLTASFVMLPALLLGAMRHGTDSIFHARWMKYFAEQFWSGEFYPRWLMDMNGGFGSPAFFIYPPFSQFVTALLHPLLPDPGSAALLLGISVWLAMASSGIACFYWLCRALPGQQFGAVAGSVAYMLAPYHLWVDVYQRGAVAEVWAFVWPPLSLLLVHRLDRITPASLALVALTVAGLLVTHAPSSLILIPGYFLYALVLDWRDRRMVRCVWLVVGCGLGCLLAGWYLGPALTHTRYIHAAALFGGRNQSVNWLIGGGAWPDPVIQRAISIAIGLQGVITLAAAGFAFLKSGRDARGMALASLLMAVPALALMSNLSRPVWELGLPLNQIQFPWRFGVLLSLAGALAVAAFSTRCLISSLKLAVIPLILLIGNGLIACFPADYSIPPAEMPAPVSPSDSSWDAPEYQLAARSAVDGVFGAEKVRLESGVGTLGIVEWRPRSVVFDADLKQVSTIAIRQFDYPGWGLSGMRGNANLPVLEQGKPYLQVQAPAGQYRIHLVLAETLPEWAGRIASLLAAIVVTGLLGWGLAARRKLG
jgi:hypothetical protein